MESQFSSQGPITKLSSITRNFSGSHPQRRVFESFKSITDIRKTDLRHDLSKKFFGVFTEDNRNDSLKDLMSNEFKSIKDKQLNAGTNNYGKYKTKIRIPKNKLYKDQSVQTDIREFAKIKLSSDLCENASNYMQFAEEFIQELESQCFPNSMDLTQTYNYGNRQTDINANDNQFNAKTISTNETLNYHIFNTKCIPNQININSKPQSPSHTNAYSCGLILDSSVFEYEGDYFQIYEFGEEAHESQLELYHKINFSQNVSKVKVQSESKPIKWSDLLQLIKFNQFSKFKILDKYFK